MQLVEIIRRDWHRSSGILVCNVMLWIKDCVKVK